MIDVERGFLSEPREATVLTTVRGSSDDKPTQGAEKLICTLRERSELGALAAPTTSSAVGVGPHGIEH
jgi:hypothetical protein